MLRASGVAYDVRRAQPYSYYDQLDFNVAVRYNGDIYDRYLVRVDEIYESIKIIKQVLPHLKRPRTTHHDRQTAVRGTRQRWRSVQSC